MSESLKGFCTVLEGNPPRIQVKWDWDRVALPDFAGVKIFWWCIGDHEAENLSLWRHTTRCRIAVKPGETYVVASRAYFTVNPHTGVAGHYSTKWAYTVVEVPQNEQYTDLGQVTVIDTPRGPAILLDGLRDPCC